MKFKNTDIFVDVDGTIFAPELKKVSPELLTEFMRLRKAGHRIFLATGRTSSFLHPSLYPSLCDGYVLAHGQQVLLEDKVLYSKYIPSSIVQALLDIFNTRGIDFVCYSDEYSYLNRFSSDLHHYLEELYIDSARFKLVDNFNYNRVYKIEAWAKEEVNWDRIFSHFDALKYDPDPVSLRVDINLSEYSKGTGIAKLLEKLKSSRPTVCFGDGRNDLEMFELIDFPIAMENGSEELKKKAKLIAPSVYENGVLKVLKTYFN